MFRVLTSRYHGAYQARGKELPFMGQLTFSLYTAIAAAGHPATLHNEHYHGPFADDINDGDVVFVMVNPYNYRSAVELARNTRARGRDARFVGFAVCSFGNYLARRPDFDFPVLTDWPEAKAARLVEAVSANFPAAEQFAAMVNRLNDEQSPAERVWSGVSAADYYGMHSPDAEYFALDPSVSSASLFTHRGCPVGCAYCPYFGVPLQRVDYDMIERNIGWISDNLPGRRLNILDPTFNLGTPHCERVCSMITSINPSLRWWSETVVLKDPPLERMAAAGMVATSIGIESGSPRIQKDILRKNVRLDLIPDVLRRCQDLGIRVQTLLMVGVPTETEEDLEMTKRIADIARKCGHILTVTGAYMIDGTVFGQAAQETKESPGRIFEHGDNPYFPTEEIERRRAFILDTPPPDAPIAPHRPNRFGWLRRFIPNTLRPE
ncbi:MAG: radical SAM protein [Alphaproteobacteria bacterium]|nr:radical SAM protein [Alphaproteobacteria bacterium]